jgi:nitrous oxidase accessory protein
MIVYKREGEFHLMKKGLMLGFTILLASILSIPSQGMMIRTDIQSPTLVGTIHYVGGNGPNNYTTIQQAINNATTGDTVFVYDDSSPYFEHIIINVSIHLIGENNTTTILDGENQGDVVLFTADSITMTGFTIQHSGDTAKIDAGIESRSDRNVIIGNRIIYNGAYAIGIFLNGSSENLVTKNFISENGREGLFLQNAVDCVIKDNLFTKNGHCAIIVSYSNRNMITKNTMSENYATVSLWPGAIDNEISWNLMRNQEYSGVGIWPGANDNDIHHNYLSNISLYGFIITNAEGNIIANNTIWGSNEGIHLTLANSTTIKFNNFIKNNINAFFENSSFNRWKKNYWDDHLGFWPKCIKGLIREPWNKTIVIHWINIDWFPAKKPYDIPYGDGAIR